MTFHRKILLTVFVGATVMVVPKIQEVHAQAWGPATAPSVGNPARESNERYTEYDHLPDLKDASYYGNANGTHSVARIIQKNCVTCHQLPNPAAGLSLDTKASISAAAWAIKTAVITQEMPHGRTLRADSHIPFKGQNLQFGPQQLKYFKDKALLSREDVATIASWVSHNKRDVAGNQRPNSNLDRLHDVRQVNGNRSGWRIGQPDLILYNGGFVVPPGDQDITQNFILDSDAFKNKDRLVTAIQIQPSDEQTDEDKGIKRVVHHAHILIDKSGCSNASTGFVSVTDQESKFHAENPDYCEPGFPIQGPKDVEVLSRWFPGGEPTILPQGVAEEIPPCAKVILEVHYVNNGTKPVVDNTRVGFKFASKPVDKLVQHALAHVDSGWKIPAGAKNAEMKVDFKIDKNIIINTIQPHMHQYGIDEELIAEFPPGYVDQVTGKSSKVVLAAKWDFDHQSNYELPEPQPKPSDPTKDPRYYPAGTVFHYRAHYKNDTKNLSPDPETLRKWNLLSPQEQEALRGTAQDPQTPVDIVSGHDSRNEMFQVLLGYTIPGQHLKVIDVNSLPGTRYASDPDQAAPKNPRDVLARYENCVARTQSRGGGVSETQRAR